MVYLCIWPWYLCKDEFQNYWIRQLLSLDRHSLFLTRNRFITCTLTAMGRIKVFASRSLENLEFCSYHKFTNKIHHKPIWSFVYHLLKRAWDLVYPGQNRDFWEFSKNRIGYLEDWELEKTYFSWKIKNPGLLYLRDQTK